MGAVLSLTSSKAAASKLFHNSGNETSKRQKLSSQYEDDPRLIPCFPDGISLSILARLPRICYLNVKSVSRAWKAAITSAELYKLRKELGTAEEWLYVLTKDGKEKLLWYSFDPLSERWQRLPPKPHAALENESRKSLASHLASNVMGSTIKIVDAVSGWLGRKDELDEMPFCGCAVGVVEGCLYVLGGLSKFSATKCVRRYDPVSNEWSEVSPMSTGRAYCRTAMLNNKLYVVGGVTRRSDGLTPLQCAEVFDPKTGVWSQMPSMPFSNAQVLPSRYLNNLLSPMATGMTSYRGKLFVPQSLYCCPFFVDIGGEAYDPETNSWVQMPIGMSAGWPARQAGTKLGVTINEKLYALDPSSSPDSARIKVYNCHDDAWNVVTEGVSTEEFSDPEKPYLLAGLLGKLHVITKGADDKIVVLQADDQNISESITFPSSSSSDNSSKKHSKLAADTLPDLWKVVATRNASETELVSCQTLSL